MEKQQSGIIATLFARGWTIYCAATGEPILQEVSDNDLMMYMELFN